MRPWVRRNRGSIGARLAAALVAVLAVLIPGTGGRTVRAEEAESTPVWTTNTAGLEAWGVSCLQIHSKAPELMWAHVHGLGVARSAEGGTHWEAMQKGIDARHVPGPRDVCEITLDPRDEKILWLVTKGQIYKSEDQGETWQHVSTGALASWSWDRSRSAMAIRGVAVDPKKSLRILAGTRTEGKYRGGLYESNDGGKTWEQIAGDDQEKSELSCDAWPIVLDPRTDKNVAVGGSFGFWYSSDRGRKFKRADPGEIGVHDVRALTELSTRAKNLYLADGRGLWSSRDGGKRWDKDLCLVGDCVTVASDPHIRRRLYAVLRDKGVLVSEDAKHEKWDELGHAGLDVHQVLRHPRDKTRLYYASPTTGLHLSGDGGVTVAPVRGNVEPYVPLLAAVAVHPAEAGRVMAVSDHGVVFNSADGGVTWLAGGRLGMQPTFLMGDAETTAMWWAAGRELIRSPDNGATWEIVYKPADPEDRILDVQRLADGSLWLLLERSQLVLHSTDGGQTWQSAKSPRKSPGAWAASFAVDATRPDHLLLATRSLSRQWKPKDDLGGPWESWDGGKTWRPLTEGLLDDDKPRRNWNRGTVAAIDAASGVMFYAAEGLGLFARRAHDPASKKPDQPPAWVDVSPPVPSPKVNAFLLRALPDDAGTELLVQVEGENDTRTFVRTLTSAVLERLAAPDGEAQPSLWSEVPDPPARLAWLAGDPHVAGRMLGTDRDGGAGVLIYGVPGAPTEAPPAEGPAPEEPAAGPPPPEGLLAFTAGADGQVRVWSLAEGKVLSGLSGSIKEVLAVALAPDESVLAVGGADQTVLLYSGRDGKRIEGGLDAAQTGGTVNGLAFGPDSKKLYVALQQSWSVIELDLATGETRAFDAHTAGVTSVLALADGKRMVSCSRDHTIRCWDLEQATPLWKADLGSEVLCLAASPDGKRLFAGGRGAFVRAYDLETGADLGSSEVQRSYISGLATTADGARVYTAGDRGIVPVDAVTLAPVSEPLMGPTRAMFCVAVSHDGAWVAGGDADNGLWVWRAGEAKPWWFNTAAHAGPVHAVVLTPDAAPEEGPGDQPDDAGGAGG